MSTRCLLVLLVPVFILTNAVAEVAAEALPEYQPSMEVTGVLRSRGSDRMASLMKRWQDGFTEFHPEVQFEDSLKGSASGMYGLDMRTADLALMGRPINPYERYGIYERSWVYPVEIEVATGHPANAHSSPAYAILVHRDNPLSEISIEQLDGIFGAQRQGGWQALSWDESAARDRSKNIRTWRQLGVEGPLANQPINAYAPPLLGAGVVTAFQNMVLGGGAMWNEDLKEYADRDAMIAALAADPAGIAYTALEYATDGVKPLAVSASPHGRAVELNEHTVADRSYPLVRPVYIVYAIDDVHARIAAPAGDPRVREFLRYVLSRQGQDDVRRDGTYLPLPGRVVDDQRHKMDTPNSLPPERLLLAR